MTEELFVMAIYEGNIVLRLSKRVALREGDPKRSIHTKQDAFGS